MLTVAKAWITEVIIAYNLTEQKEILIVSSRINPSASEQKEMTGDIKAFTAFLAQRELVSIQSREKQKKGSDQ